MGCKMNRRELLQAALGTAFASGITEVQTLDMDKNTIALVLRHPGVISSDAYKCMRESFKRILKGTPIEKIPIIILGEGMSLEAVRLPK